MPARPRSPEIKLTRLYDAPVRAVWDAWTEPDQVAQWWGPRGFTHTTESKDLRPGGIWRYTMHGPDGTDYPNDTRYHEVERYARLVYDHGANDTSPPLFRVTVMFTDVRGKTRLDMSMTLPTPEAADETRRFIKKVGGNATWDRLAEYLHQRSSGKEQFVINRSFDAPIARMFEMWTDPEHFSRWLPPTGAKMQSLARRHRRRQEQLLRDDQRPRHHVRPPRLPRDRAAPPHRLHPAVHRRGRAPGPPSPRAAVADDDAHHRDLHRGGTRQHARHRHLGTARATCRSPSSPSSSRSAPA